MIEPSAYAYGGGSGVQWPKVINMSLVYGIFILPDSDSDSDSDSGSKPHGYIVLCRNFSY